MLSLVYGHVSRRLECFSPAIFEKWSFFSNSLGTLKIKSLIVNLIVPIMKIKSNRHKITDLRIRTMRHAKNVRHDRTRLHWFRYKLGPPRRNHVWKFSRQIPATSSSGCRLYWIAKYSNTEAFHSYEN